MCRGTEGVLLPQFLKGTFQIEDLQKKIAEERYTRFPVYEGTLDNIIGLVHIKDVFTPLSKRNSGEPLAVQSILRPILTVPKTTAITKLMTLMQHKKAHLTVVISEYGETAGIVTLEDILEEIVGEVQDEFDTLEEGVRSEVEVLANGSYSVDGLMTVECPLVLSTLRRSQVTYSVRLAAFPRWATVSR